MPENGTVIIDQDTTVTEPVAVSGKNVVVDLAGNKLTAEKTAFKVAGGSLEIYNGTVESAVDAVSVDATKAETNVTIHEGVKLTAAECAVFAKGKANILIEGELASTGAYAAVQGNGQASSAGTVITLGPTAKIVSNDVGVYFPQEGTLNIEGASITGKTAVFLKGSEFNMTSGTLVANGPAAEFKHNNNGCDATGDALVVENSDYPAGAPVVNIIGGTFTSANGKAVASYAQEGYEPIVGFIKGGTFNTDPAADGLVADGYKSAKSGKNFKVTAA